MTLFKKKIKTIKIISCENFANNLSDSSTVKVFIKTSQPRRQHLQHPLEVFYPLVPKDLRKYFEVLLFHK